MADPIARLYAKRRVELFKKLRAYTAPKALQFRASELGNCKTALYYRLAGYIPAMEHESSTGYSYDGDMHHDQVRNFLRQAGIKVHGVSFNKDGTVTEDTSMVLPVTFGGIKFNVSMRLDGIVNISSRKHVLEIKSVGFWKYKPIADVWAKTGSEAAVAGYIAAERRDFMYQTHACMLGLKIPRTYLLLKDRDGCKVGLHSGDKIIGGPIITFDQHVWDEACQRIALVAKHLELDSPPPPEFLPTSYECKVCKYRHLCHDAERRRKNGIQPAVVHPQLGAKIHVNDRG